MDRIPMTREGFEQARKRLDHLKYTEMPRIQKALQIGRASCRERVCQYV